MKHVVSVTPMALRRDKRTFQNAASLSRLGYRSTVVQGEPGELDGELPFELITVPGAQTMQGVEAEEAPKGNAPQSAPARRRALKTWVEDRRDRYRERKALTEMLRDSQHRDNERAYSVLPEADLYYVTHFYQYPAIARKCDETGAPYIYDANDAYWKWPGYRWYPAGFRLRLRLLELRCARGAAAFVTVSEGVAGLLRHRVGRRPRVVRNMHDLRIDADGVVDVRRAAGLRDDAFAVVIVGNEKPSDAVEPAIAALASLPDRVHLVALGAGYEKHFARAAELGVGDRFHIVPPVPPDQVTSAIRTADACLINIRATEVHMHALPTRLFSAIAAGLPLVYPSLPEVKALCEEHALGFEANAEDAGAIAGALRRLAEDPGTAAEIRANVERARGVLNWEHEERVLAEIVAGALES